MRSQRTLTPPAVTLTAMELEGIMMLVGIPPPAVKAEKVAEWLQATRSSLFRNCGAVVLRRTKGIRAALLEDGQGASRLSTN